MFIPIKHQQMLVVKIVREMLKNIYAIINHFPKDEKYSMVTQLRRAALSVYLNITEGCTRNSPKERLRFFEIARGSLIEVDSIFDIAHDLGYLNDFGTEELGQSIIVSFRLLSRLITATNAQ
jgi:four helix bundle protein